MGWDAHKEVETYLNIVNIAAIKKQVTAMKKKLTHKRQRLAAEQRKAATANEKILQLKEEIRQLEDSLTLLLSRLGRSAEEALELLESTIPAEFLEEEIQERDAPEQEGNHEEAE